MVYWMGRDPTVGVKFLDETGRYSTITIFFTTGPDIQKVNSRRDGTVCFFFRQNERCIPGITFHDGTGRYFFFFHDGTGPYCFCFFFNGTRRFLFFLDGKCCVSLSTWTCRVSRNRGGPREFVRYHRLLQRREAVIASGRATGAVATRPSKTLSPV